MTGSSPRSWLVRARRGGRRTRDRQLAPAVAGARTPGGRGYTRQARCPGRGRFAHSGAGEELPDDGDAPANALAVARLCTPGREDGRWTGQRALVVACWRTPGRVVGRWTGQRALVVACWRTPGRVVERWTGQRALVVACWRTPGREVGRWIGQRALVVVCWRQALVNHRLPLPRGGGLRSGGGSNPIAKSCGKIAGKLRKNCDVVSGRVAHSGPPWPTPPPPE